MIVALCGGVGGSKLVYGLYHAPERDQLSVVVNTADDHQFHGLHVSPDVDTVMYTLAGLAGPKGWGITGDTFHTLEMLERYGAEAWFRVGDRDLATDIIRTEALRRGEPLSVITRAMARGLGIAAEILPMTNDPVRTEVQIESGWLSFQDYFVRRGHRDPVSAVRYAGAEAAQPTGEVLTALNSAGAIILVNSNPVLSILPLLAVPGIRQALAERQVPAVAVSPMVGMDAVSGPAGDLMALLGCPSTATGVAMAYRGMIDGLVIDRQDAGQSNAIRDLGIAVLPTEAIMRSPQDKIRLAQEAVSFARSLA